MPIPLPQHLGWDDAVRGYEHYGMPNDSIRAPEGPEPAHKSMMAQAATESV